MNKSLWIMVCWILCLTVVLTSCTDSNRGTETTGNGDLQSSTSNLETAVRTNSSYVTYDEEDSDSSWQDKELNYITLDGTEASFEGEGAIVQSGKVLIKLPGVYVISGNWENGQILVDLESAGTAQLVLNGVSLHMEDSAPIFIKKAEKTVLTLAEGTDNVISDGANYVYTNASDDEPSAAIFSKADLTINGSGALTVHANFKDGIVSRDDLKIMDGTVHIYSVDDGLIGRDLLAVRTGQLHIEAAGDGMKSTNDEDTSKGQIVLEGGVFEITSGSDAVQSIASLTITDGQYRLMSGGGAGNTQAGGNSSKGLKATTDLVISGGLFTIDTADDALHSNGHITVANGNIVIKTGDDGIHADAALTITGGTIDINDSYEGIESKVITVTGGDLSIVSSDDGVNIAGGNDSHSQNRRFGNDQFAADGDSKLIISGGRIVVDAAGDGLDSNGSIEMSGGTVLVHGPTASNNGAIDYDGTFTISGGVLLAAGSSRMAQAPSEEQSAQPSIMMYYTQQQQAGTIVHLADSSGETIATFAPSKEYEAILISTPMLTKDETYTLYSGGTPTGIAEHGLYSDAAYTGGNEIVSFSISNSVTWMSETGETSSRGSGPGRRSR